MYCYCSSSTTAYWAIQPQQHNTSVMWWTFDVFYISPWPSWVEAGGGGWLGSAAGPNVFWSGGGVFFGLFWLGFSWLPFLFLIRIFPMSSAGLGICCPGFSCTHTHTHTEKRTVCHVEATDAHAYVHTSPSLSGDGEQVRCPHKPGGQKHKGIRSDCDETQSEVLRSQASAGVTGLRTWAEWNSAPGEESVVCVVEGVDEGLCGWTHRVLVQGVCQQSVSKYGLTVVGHLLLLLHPGTPQQHRIIYCLSGRLSQIMIHMQIVAVKTGCGLGRIRQLDVRWKI